MEEEEKQGREADDVKMEGAGERGRKGTGMRPKCRKCRTRYGCRRSLLRWIRAPGSRA